MVLSAAGFCQLVITLYIYSCQHFILTLPSGFTYEWEYLYILYTMFLDKVNAKE